MGSKLTKWILTLAVGLGGAAKNTGAMAASNGPSMPWDSGLQQIQNALTGNTAHALIIMAIALTGIAIAVGESDSLFRKAACIVFGGSVAVGAVSLYSSLRFSGAVI